MSSAHALESQTTGSSNTSTLSNSYDVAAKSTTIAELPMEILWNILQRLNAKDLTSFRLTAKKYAAAGRSLLCVNVNFTETRASLDRLLLISSQDKEITSSVKHLQYMPFDFAPEDISPSECLPECMRGVHLCRSIADAERDCDELYEEKLKLHRMYEVLLALLLAFRQIRPSSLQMSIQNQQGYKHHSPHQLNQGPHKLYNELKERQLVKRVPSHRVIIPGHGPIMSRSLIDLLLAVALSGIKMERLEAATGLALFATIRDMPMKEQISDYESVRMSLSNLIELRLQISFHFKEARSDDRRIEITTYPRLSSSEKR